MTLLGLRSVVNKKFSNTPMLASKRIFKALPKAYTPEVP